MIRRTVVGLVALVAFPVIVDAQESRISAPGATPDSPADPLGAQTSTGSFVFRYGVGARVAF